MKSRFDPFGFWFSKGKKKDLTLAIVLDRNFLMGNPTGIFKMTFML